MKIEKKGGSDDSRAESNPFAIDRPRGLLNPDGHVDLKGPRRIGAEAWERLQMAIRGRTPRNMAQFGDRPTILPYMSGQPKDARQDPRVGLSFAELRAAGYPEQYIVTPKSETDNHQVPRRPSRTFGTATALSDAALHTLGLEPHKEEIKDVEF